jgi:hypothetical protein
MLEINNFYKNRGRVFFDFILQETNIKGRMLRKVKVMSFFEQIHSAVENGASNILVIYE